MGFLRSSLSSLRVKLLLLSIGTSLILGLVLGVVWLFFQINVALTEAGVANDQTRGQIQSILTDELTDSDQSIESATEHIARAFFSEDGVVYAEFTTLDGRVIAAKTQRFVGKQSLDDREIADALKDNKSVVELYALQKDGDVFSTKTEVETINPFDKRELVQEYTVLMTTKGREKIVLHIYFSMARLVATTRSLVGLATLIVLGITLLGGTFSFYLLDRLIYAPITRLSEAAERITSGDVSERVEVVGRDEFSELARTFNSMADSLTFARFQADTDSLTGLFNYRHLQNHLVTQIALAGRYNRELTVAMFDIDHFKNVNDLYGHQTGDAVLIMAVEYIESQLRQVDYMARYGGEEFVVIMPETGAQAAIKVMERIRTGFPQHVYVERMGIKNPIFISIGIADYPHCGHDATNLLAASDIAMLLAKRRGRNQISYSRAMDQESG